MNIKTITLMDFDWDDFIEAIKVNIRARAARSPNYDSNDYIFKSHFKSFI